MEKRNLIGTNLKKYRKLQNLSQENFVAKLNLVGFSLEQSVLLRIEGHSREVYDYELLFFSKVLNIDINYLYKDIDSYINL